MAMTVKKSVDAAQPKVFGTNGKIGDIPGGVGVVSAELSGDYLLEGTVLSQRADGMVHVVKIATLTAGAGASVKTYTVAKNHHLKAGDFVMTAVGGKAVKVTAVAANAATDTITVETALGTLDAGAQLIQAKAAADGSNTHAEFMYQPQSLAGTTKPVEKGSNLDVDAWVIGVYAGKLPADVVNALKGIVVI